MFAFNFILISHTKFNDCSLQVIQVNWDRFMQVDEDQILSQMTQQAVYGDPSNPIVHPILPIVSQIQNFFSFLFYDFDRHNRFHPIGSLDMLQLMCDSDYMMMMIMSHLDFEFILVFSQSNISSDTAWQSNARTAVLCASIEWHIATKYSRQRWFAECNAVRSRCGQ